MSAGARSTASTAEARRGDPGAGRPRDLLLMGVPLARSQLLELADLLDGERLAALLRRAHERQVIAFALAPDEAERILSVLSDPPPGFEELRSVLLRETEPLRAASRSTSIQMGVRRT